MSFWSPSLNSVASFAKLTRAALTTVRSLPNVSKISTKPISSERGKTLLVIICNSRDSLDRWAAKKLKTFYSVHNVQSSMFRPLSSVIHYIYDVIQLTVDPPPLNHLENGTSSDSGYRDKPGSDYIVLDVAPQVQLSNCRQRIGVTKGP